LKTTQGAQAVTPGYSPYEQYGKGTTDARTDIYALGATLYMLLTAQDPPESIQRVVRDPLVLARQLNPAISLRTSSALARAMQMDPLQRFQSAADFKAALCPPQAAHGSNIPPLQRPAPPASPPCAAAAAPSTATPGHAPSGWLLAIGVLSLVILALVVAVFSNVLNNRRSPAGATGQNLPISLNSPTSDSAGLVTSTATAAAALTPTAIHQPTQTPLIYVVQIGDTCSEIAQQFGVSAQAIASLNGLPEDCGIIYAGQKLLLPGSAHLAILSATPTSSPTPPQPVSTQVSAVDGMVMVYIPSSTFIMGSTDADADAGDEEKPQRIVYLRAFWIDRYEVTNAMYARCVRDGVCPPPQMPGSKTRAAYFDEPGYENYPVIYVSWEEARKYCEWAGRRLPTEAEWEKASRGVEGQIYPWGDQPPVGNLANFGGKVGDTSRAGSYPDGASPYGVLDMAGNVLEWVADWYGADYYASSADNNPGGPPSGEFRVLRGGSWFNMARSMRSAFRLWNYPDVRTDTIGFRCAR
jgi:formylglycine-generating enzyme required for sulfatase activity